MNIDTVKPESVEKHAGRGHKGAGPLNITLKEENLWRENWEFVYWL